MMSGRAVWGSSGSLAHERDGRQQHGDRGQCDAGVVPARTPAEEDHQAAHQAVDAEDADDDGEMMSPEVGRLDADHAASLML